MDPYEILGISADASPEDIETAFRRKLLECHPDLHNDDPQATSKARQVIEARSAIITARAANDRTMYFRVTMVSDPEYSRIQEALRNRMNYKNNHKEYKNGTFSSDSAEEAMYKSAFAFLYRASLNELLKTLKEKYPEIYAYLTQQ